ncbi:MAG: PD-(D/E)XK nuclease family protein [Senegalia sp. (in: firmicutes)]
MDSLNDVKEKKLRLSYSRISALDEKGPDVLINRPKIDNVGVKMGALIDDLTLQPESFSKNYYKFDGKKPTATLGKLSDIIIKNFVEIPSKEKILEVCKNNNFWKRRSDESITKEFDKKEFYDYINAYISCKDKIMITSQDYKKATEIRDVLLTHRFSKHIFKADRYIYQCPFTIDIEGVDVRGFIDIVNINDKDKTVEIIDLKTGAPKALDFYMNFYRHRYYFQAAIYQRAFEAIKKEFEIPDDYTLLPFQFLYISRTERIPLVYEVEEKWYKAAFHGFTLNDKSYKGIYELIEDAKWHWKNKIFDLPRDIYENQGKILMRANRLKV